MKQRAQPWLGTLVEITIADALGDAQLNSCFDHAFARVADVHRLMSFHDPASDVSRINRAAIGEAVEIHAHTYEVMRCALSMAAASGGLFDVSCAPKLVEWGYLPALAGALPEHVPGRCALVLQDGQRIKKTSAAWIDLGGIAKGYAVDLAIAALREKGIRSACVNAGGDLRAFGDIAYPVVIRNPAYPNEAGLRAELRDQALATSGTYFSRKQVGDRECSALVNGSDSRAITVGFSASIRAPTCMLADALAKVVMASADPRHPALQQFGAAAFIMSTMRHPKRSLHRPSSPLRHANLRPERWQRRCVYGVSAWLAATGALWLLAHYLMRPVAEFGESVHPLEPWSMKLHGAGAMLALFFIGGLVHTHISRALKSRRNLYSGWSMISVLMALSVSGYALYYIASEQSRPFWSAAHWVAGLVFALLLLAHIALTQRRT